VYVHIHIHLESLRQWTRLLKIPMCWETYKLTSHMAVRVLCDHYDGYE
jgi:hypothetical protein